MEPIPEKRRVKQNGVIENENELMNKQKMLICWSVDLLKY